MISVFKEKKEGSFEWVDVLQPTKAELAEIATKYNLHAAIVEDCLQPDHLPKHEIVGESQFIILRAYNINCSTISDTIQEITDKIAIFLGDDFIITIHRPDFEFLKEIKDKHIVNGKSTTPDHVLFRIFEHVIGTLDTPLASLIEEIDQLEPRIFLSKKTPDLLRKLYYIKRRGTVMDHMLELSKPIHENLKGKIASPNYNHLKDEFVRLQTSTKHIVDSVSHLLNIYISISSQRTSEVMRILTLFSVFFMPLTFIVGIYGMNFDVMPELRWTYGYPATIAVMLSLTVTIYFWYKRKGWL